MHKNRLWGRVGIAAVSLVWLVSAMANGWAGYHLSNAPELGIVLAAASVAIDIMKAVALFVITAAICNRRWVAARRGRRRVRIVRGLVAALGDGLRGQHSLRPDGREELQGRAAADGQGSP